MNSSISATGLETDLRRTKRGFLLIAAVAVSTSLCGCSHLTPLHGNSAGNPTNSINSGVGYQLAFIEFGEQGSYQDTNQLQNAVGLIKRTSRPLVITYVHGWHNNARSADVSKFSEWLSELSQTELIRSSGFHLVGVYLGWRGELTTAPILHQLTFYSRKAAAERLASNFDCYDAIAAISEAARKFHQGDRQYTVLIGHSFGGLVVERSVAHAINAEMHGHASGAPMPDVALHHSVIDRINRVERYLPVNIPHDEATLRSKFKIEN